MSYLEKFKTKYTNADFGTQDDKSKLLHEISGLFDRLEETTNSAKKYWLGVWLQNKRYPQVQSRKELSQEQLQELRDDILEVLNC